LTALAVVLLLGVAAAVIAVATRRGTMDAHTIDQVVSRLVVDVPAGEIRAVTGDRVEVEKRVRWALVPPVVKEGVSAGVWRLTVRSSWLSFARVDVRLTVPPGVALEASTSAGKVTIRGLSGAVTVHAGAGSIHAVELSSGEVHARSSAGSVLVGFVAPPVLVDAESGAGSVEVLVPAGTYAVDATAGAGQVRIEVPTDPASGHKVRARSGAGSILVSTRR
jgi:hypothetical protein